MIRSGLSLAKLGLILVGVACAAWLTGLPYLFVRFGLQSPIPLARVDGPHVYAGLAMAAVLLVKALDVGLRTRLPRLPAVQLWQRWISMSLLALYAAVFASGLALLLPWPAVVRRDLVDLHLMTAVWAALATLVHVFVYLRRRLPAGVVDRRLVIVVAALLLPAAAVATMPVALSPLAQLQAGAAWAPVGPSHAMAFRLLWLPDGRLLSAGQGLLLSSDQGVSWKAVHQLDGELLLAADAGPAGAPVYVGGPGGLFRAAQVGGPYSAVTAPASVIDSIFIDPRDGSIWAGGRGIWRSADQGASWTPALRGVIARGSIWAFALHDGSLYMAGSTGVYRLAGSIWQRVLDLPEVVSLDEGAGGLWASSMGGGVAVLRDGRWTRSNAGLAVHGGRAIHQTAFVGAGQNTAFAGNMDRGVWESLDGGSSWYPLSPEFRPGSVWRMLEVRDGLLAATDTGLYRYRFPAAPAPIGHEWIALMAIATAFSVVVVYFGLRPAAQALIPETKAGSPLLGLAVSLVRQLGGNRHEGAVINSHAMSRASPQHSVLIDLPPRAD